jgi:hypothetical protein
MSPQQLVFAVFLVGVQHDFSQESNSRNLMYAVVETHNIKRPKSNAENFIHQYNEKYGLEVRKTS